MCQYISLYCQEYMRELMCVSTGLCNYEADLSKALQNIGTVQERQALLILNVIISSIYQRYNNVIIQYILLIINFCLVNPLTDY